MTDRQCTVAKRARYSGIALHTGVRAHATLAPAPPDSGVVISRVDLPGKPKVRAGVENVVDVRRATTIADGEARVHTTEHMLAALYAMGIDNVLVEMDGPEPPIADGSSAPYIDLIREAGIAPQDAPREILEITDTHYYEDGDTRVLIMPYHEYRITCTVKYGVCLMDCQYFSLAVDGESFTEELSRARTFCAYHEIESLMLAGLIRGGSLDNAVVMKDGAIISKDGLRYEDEFVRHKILDIVGDLSLVGQPLRGHVIAIKPGHPANVALAQKIVAAKPLAKECSI